jgi:hypothetical protein
MVPLPTSDQAWIADVLDGLRRRSRALKHKTHSVECERVFEEADGQRIERLDLTLRHSRSSQGFVLRAKTWEDRWTWIDARGGGKSGWSFEWSTEGRAAGGLTGQKLTAAIEETFDAIATASATEDGALGELWKPILLHGPRTI